MNYCQKISRTYGRLIPAEYLIKAVRYQQPRPGIVTDNLFLSWGRLTDKLPEPDFRAELFEKMVLAATESSETNEPDYDDGSEENETTVVIPDSVDCEAAGDRRIIPFIPPVLE